MFRERLKNEQNKRALALTICSAEFGRTTVPLKFADDTLESASEHRGRMAYLTGVRRKRKWYFDCQLQILAEKLKWLTAVHS